MGNDQRWVFVAASVAVIAVFFVLREHWAHVLGPLPYVVLLACPLLHLFHRHGHRNGQPDGHDHSGGKDRDQLSGGTK